MTLPTEANLVTYITTNWTVANPTTIAAEATLFNRQDSVTFTERKGDPVPVSAGISKREKIFDFRLSHATKAAVDTLIGYLEDYTGLQKPPRITKEYQGYFLSEYVWKGTITFTEWS